MTCTIPTHHPLYTCHFTFFFLSFFRHSGFLVVTFHGPKELINNKSQYWTWAYNNWRPGLPGRTVRARPVSVCFLSKGNSLKREENK